MDRLLIVTYINIRDFIWSNINFCVWFLFIIMSNNIEFFIAWNFIQISYKGWNQQSENVFTPGLEAGQLVLHARTLETELPGRYRAWHSSLLYVDKVELCSTRWNTFMRHNSVANMKRRTIKLTFFTKVLWN